MNRKSVEERAKIIQLLVEGNSMRSTSRIADCSINTVTKLLEDVGAACEEYQDKAFVNLPCTRIEVDEIWSFCFAKKGNSDKGGDLWTFTSICPDTKLVPCWRVGPREAVEAHAFLQDLHDRIPHRFQLTSDGWRGYRSGSEGLDVDFGRIVKKYSEPQGQRFGGYKGQVKEAYSGNPNPDHIQTVHVERHNLTMRMSNRRFARKTNAHSKKAENHALAIAFHMFYYNMVRIHSKLRVTPAMAAGVTDRLWSIEDMVKL